MDEIHDKKTLFDKNFQMNFFGKRLSLKLQLVISLKFIE